MKRRGIQVRPDIADPAEAVATIAVIDAYRTAERQGRQTWEAGETARRANRFDAAKHAAVGWLKFLPVLVLMLVPALLLTHLVTNPSTDVPNASPTSDIAQQGELSTLLLWSSLLTCPLILLGELTFALITAGAYPNNTPLETVAGRFYRWLQNRRPRFWIISVILILPAFCLLAGCSALPLSLLLFAFFLWTFARLVSFGHRQQTLRLRLAPARPVRVAASTTSSR